MLKDVQEELMRERDPDDFEEESCSKCGVPKAKEDPVEESKLENEYKKLQSAHIALRRESVTLQRLTD